MNLSEYASKLRTHAAAAAKKIPTFDDMAAKDEYIHSEEFNVPRRSVPRSNVSVVTTGKGIDPDEVSSVSSAWSLLDRPSLQMSQISLPTTTGGEQMSDMRQEFAMDVTNSISANTSLSSSGPIPQPPPSAGLPPPSQASSIARVPWLAVVTNALDEKQQQQQQQQPSVHADDGIGRGGYGSGVSSGDRSDSLDSNSSSDDDDDEDPILSMIRTQKDRKVKTTRTRQKIDAEVTIRSTQPFINEEQIPPTQGKEIDDGVPLSVEPAKESDNSQRAGFRGPFGGLVINLARDQLNKLIRGPDVTRNQSSTSRLPPPPPLKTERKNRRTPNTARYEDEFHQTSSSVVLGDDDMAQLLKLRNSSSSYTSQMMMMTKVLQENHHFGFILFTFILALVIFYFQQAADNVS